MTPYYQRVWICSGQSNMERPFGLWGGQQPIDRYQEETAAANYPELRHFQVPQKGSDTG